MSSLAVAFLTFGCSLASTLAAMALARRLPAHHLSGESRDVVKLGLSVIATLTALVLGLLVAATKGTYDAQGGTVKELAAQLAVIDRLLERYGPEAAAARGRLRELARTVAEQVRPRDDAPVDFVGGPSRQAGEAFFDAVAALEPRTDTQRLLRARAQDATVGLGHLRQRLVVNAEHSIPSLLLVMLGVWQAILFGGFGLLAPRNPTTAAFLVVCLASASGALFLVLELERPFEGIVRVSDAPLRAVLAHLGE